MAIKTNKKAEQAARRAKEDKSYSLILEAFGLCILLELILIAFYRTFYTTDAFSLEYYMRKLWWLGLLPAAACGLWLGLWRRKGKKWMLPAWLLVFFLLASVMTLLMGHYRHVGAKLGCIGLPVLAVLYCIYLVYQREFFMTALSFSGAILALWIFRRGPNGVNSGALLLGVLLAVLVFCIWSAFSCRLGGRLWKNGPRFFPRKAEWPMLFAAYGLCLCSMAGALLLGTGFAYAAIIALGVLTFIAAVYYTVKML